MQIAPRTQLCGNIWRIGGTVEDTGFDELRELCNAAGDKVSLAVGMAGLVQALTFNDRITEAAQLATEFATLVESIGDAVLTVALLPSATTATCLAGAMVDTLRLTQRIVDLADGNATIGNLVVGSPLSVAQVQRGFAEMSLGMTGFTQRYDDALATARAADPTAYAVVVLYKYCGIVHGVYLPDDTALRETADALAIAERSGDPFAVACALLARGSTLAHRDGPESETGYDQLAKVRAMALAHQFNFVAVSIVDIQTANRMARTTDIDGAIELARTALDNLVASGDLVWRGAATTALVESLLRRSADGDIAEAQAAIDTLAAVPSDPGYVLHELPLLRMQALLARAQGDEVTYRNFGDRYRKIAADLGFEGHMKWAEAMR